MSKSKWDGVRASAEVIRTAGDRLAYCAMANDWNPMGAEIDDIKKAIGALEIFLEDPYDDDTDDECIGCGSEGFVLTDGLCQGCAAEVNAG